MGHPNNTENSLKNRPNSSSCLNKSHHSVYHILDIEIDQSVDRCDSSLFSCQVKNDDIKLRCYNDIPHFLQGNPFVVNGYRVSLSFNLCLKSLFVWSNESINIWSHLLGFLLFIFYMIHDNIVVIPAYNGTLSDHIVVSAGLICFQFCMLCSAGYHIFCCHSERASRRWLALDMAGISVGVIGVYLPGVHYAFYCLSIWRDFYLLVIVVLCVMTLVIQANPRYMSSGWVRHRITIYCSLVAYGIIPTVHWIILNGGWEAPLVQVFVPKVVLMYVLSMIAFFFFMSQCPERCLPGQFDYLGSSHQLWHILILVAFVWWHKAGQEILLFRTSHQCFD